MPLSLESRSLQQAQLAIFTQNASHYQAFEAFKLLKQPEDYSSEEYQLFLDEADEPTLELIADHQAVIDAYAPYATGVSELIASVARQRKELGNGSIKRRLDYLGSGGFAHVFAFASNDRKVAVRQTAFAPTFNYLVTTALRAVDIPRTETLLAASYDDVVTISEYVEGTPAHKLSAEALDEVSTEQVTELVATAIALAENNVTLDANAGNFLYTPEGGFTIIDFRPQNLNRKQPNIRRANVLDMVHMFRGPDLQPNVLGDRILTVFAKL